MASGLIAILDDVALLLDDMASMSKLAAKKTAGLLGDDLAVNAEKAVGFHASRELPVIWAITKGSLVNKLVIVPIALLLSAYLPWLIAPILLIGGAYLSYEGVEKVLEVFTGRHAKPVAARQTADRQELLRREKGKIKAAVRTDFILSIEIIVIALGTVMEASLAVRIGVVSVIALLATVGVYGLVALLVRMDDAGLHLIERAKRYSGFSARALTGLGRGLVASLPHAIRVLGFIGTAAMLLVGGGMFVHNIEMVHHLAEALPALLGELLVGVIVGAVVLGVVHLVGALRRSSAAKDTPER